MSEVKSKWHQNYMVWLLIGLPLAAVAGSIALLYFAIVGADVPLEHQLVANSRAIVTTSQQ